MKIKKELDNGFLIQVTHEELDDLIGLEQWLRILRNYLSPKGYIEGIDALKIIKKLGGLDK